MYMSLPTESCAGVGQCICRLMAVETWKATLNTGHKKSD